MSPVATTMQIPVRLQRAHSADNPNGSTARHCAVETFRVDPTAAVPDKLRSSVASGALAITGAETPEEVVEEPNTPVAVVWTRTVCPGFTKYQFGAYVIPVAPGMFLQEEPVPSQTCH
jgi:hypothetical protein